MVEVWRGLGGTEVIGVKMGKEVCVPLLPLPHERSPFPHQGRASARRYPQAGVRGRGTFDFFCIPEPLEI